MKEVILALVVNVSLGQSPTAGAEELFIELARRRAAALATQECQKTYKLWGGEKMVDVTHFDQWCYEATRRLYLKRFIQNMRKRSPTY